MNKNKIALIQGAFDLLNYGHVRALGAARHVAAHVIVALNGDGLINNNGRWSYKDSRPVLPWWQRKAILMSLRSVDRVVPAHTFSPLELLKRYKADVYVVGLEWKHTKQAEIEYMMESGGRIIWTPRYKGVISTTHIKLMLLEEAQRASVKAASR